MDSLTFRDGVLGDNTSVKGFKVVASDGRVGRVSWASYARGNSYLVVTMGVVRRTHRVVPAGAVGGDATQRMLNAFERAASIPQDGGF